LARRHSRVRVQEWPRSLAYLLPPPAPGMCGFIMEISRPPKKKYKTTFLSQCIHQTYIPSFLCSHCLRKNYGSGTSIASNILHPGTNLCAQFNSRFSNGSPNSATKFRLLKCLNNDNSESITQTEAESWDKEDMLMCYLQLLVVERPRLKWRSHHHCPSPPRCCSVWLTVGARKINRGEGRSALQGGERAALCSGEGQL
jgi:hypothetical protein